MACDARGKSPQKAKAKAARAALCVRKRRARLGDRLLFAGRGWPCKRGCAYLHPGAGAQPPTYKHPAAYEHPAAYNYLSAYASTNGHTKTCKNKAACTENALTNACFANAYTNALARGSYTNARAGGPYADACSGRGHTNADGVARASAAAGRRAGLAYRFARKQERGERCLCGL